MVGMYWLPPAPDWKLRIRAAEQCATASWAECVALANAPLDFLQTDRLGRLLSGRFALPLAGLTGTPVRLAVLGSANASHLLASIRVAAARRGMWIDLFDGSYGQYVQESLGDGAALGDFAPTAVLYALDARHLTRDVSVTSSAAEVEEQVERKLDVLEACWRAVRERFGAVVFQQAPLPVLSNLVGCNEHLLPGAPATVLAKIADGMRSRAATAGVHFVPIDRIAAIEGVRHWHDPSFWHAAKQEVSPAAAPLYGDLVARLLAALQGRSAKCLVLDLDNTIWGGVIGDDGPGGIVLGQGSVAGEAFVEVQRYARDLAARGVILAVCSKNDEANAVAMFDGHPEMVLRRSDIGAFVANWDDKATNLRRIARELNIAEDALVFVDDSPFERNLVRRELPHVAVPEIPDDAPAAIARTLSDAGYFEALAITTDDMARAAMYSAQQERRAKQASASDISTFLRGLDMKLTWRRFDDTHLARVVQLINKTNQFNLTLRRLSNEDVRAIMADPSAFGLHFRLQDRFGDSGIIAVVIGHVDSAGDGWIDDWVMSCRAFGRGIEQATLPLVAQEAARLGARRLLGRHIEGPRNGLVRDLYGNLGFHSVAGAPPGWIGLELSDLPSQVDVIELVEG